MSQTEDGLTIDAVVKRFADSERALGEVRERLQALASAADSADSSAASLHETSASVRAFAENAAAAVGELREVTAQARAVLEGAATILDGSALRSMEQRIDELARGLQESHDSTMSTLREIEQRVTRIDTGAARVFKNTLPRRDRNIEYPGE